MTLYGTLTSPFVRKVRIAAKLVNIPVKLELVETNPIEPNERYAKNNPLMRVPALRLDNGLVLADSKLICLYFEQKVPGILLPQNEEYWQVQSRHFLADGALDSAVLIRYEEAIRPQEKKWEAWIKGQEEKIKNTLAYLEKEIPEMEKNFYIDSIALVCLLGYLNYRKILPNWERDFVKLKAFYEKFSQQNVVLETAPP